MESSLKFPLEPESAALGAAFQAYAAAGAQKGLFSSVQECVMQQHIEIEDTTVFPSKEDETTRKTYEEQYKLFKEMATKMYG